MDRDVQIVYEQLKKIARNQKTTSYSEMGELVGLDMSTDIGRIRIAQILDDINRHEDNEGRPLLSAIVIRKDYNMPGTGFFDCAIALGRYNGNDDIVFWTRELNEVLKYWAPTPHTP